MNNKDWDLIAQFLSSEKDEDLYKEVESRKGESASFKETMDDCKLIWSNSQKLSKGRKKLVDEQAFTNCLAKMNEKIDQLEQKEQVPSKRQQVEFSTVFNLTFFQKAAAVIVLAIAVSSLAYFLGGESPTSPSSYVMSESHGDQLKKVILPDNSIVWLQAKSKLQYPQAFQGNERRVSLQGEAFFDIAHNPEQPFVIEANETETKVLGTSFNLKAQPHANRVELALLTGKVAFKYNDQLTEVVPDQMITVDKSSASLKVDQGNVRELIWQKGLLKFNDTPLASVIKALESLHQVKIDTQGDFSQNNAITGDFTGKTLEVSLKQISEILGAQLNVENHQYKLIM
ncbi:FecR domain-containing protein [Rapidithrix thailandica]|uniref:FecR domain-containing protein n=1 Tax=Rapidithrix thailandica TaxID=413964 RepID=A0AAW9S823_9BACT